MSEPQPQANALASAFPTPPPFYQNFTPENISRIGELRAIQEDKNLTHNDSASTHHVRLLDLPAELRFFQPPQPPTNGLYRCFGDIYNVRAPRIPKRQLQIASIGATPLAGAHELDADDWTAKWRAPVPRRARHRPALYTTCNTHFITRETLRSCNDFKKACQVFASKLPWIDGYTRREPGTRMLYTCPVHYVPNQTMPRPKKKFKIWELFSLISIIYWMNIDHTKPENL